MRHLAFVIVAAALGSGCPTEEPEPLDPIFDPLSRPAEPTPTVSDFASADECEGCHETQFNDWAMSSHGYAIADPVFRALVGVRHADYDGVQDTFCMQCHTAIGVRGGEVVPGFSWDDLSPVVQEGVTCVACHAITSVPRTWNAGHVFDAGAGMGGPIFDPVTTAAHASRYDAAFENSALCGSCHDVVELDGLPLERPYDEWLDSGAPEAGVQCQECHMKVSTGPAADGGADRTLHDHRFVGIDVPLQDGFLSPEEEASLRADVEELLTNAATLLLDCDATATPGGTLPLQLTVRNEVLGHALPTGSTFRRQLWLEVIVTDATGRRVYESGTLDADQDLKYRWSALEPYGDPDLVKIGSLFLDAVGQPELFPWRAAEHISNTIGPGLERTFTYFVPLPDDVALPVTLSARLLLRTHPPFLLRALGAEDLVDQVDTFELDGAVGVVGAGGR